MKLKDKVAIVTGSSKGLGKAIALGLADEGADVLVNYHSSKEEAEKVVQEIEKKGRRALLFKADTKSKKQVTDMVSFVVEQWGKIDILVNNAGVMYNTPFLEIEEEEWDKQLDTNVKGYFLCAQAVGLKMKGQGSGKIINISSTRQVQAWPGNLHYCASKGAIYMMTRVMALELAPLGIQVNSIAPGTIITELNQANFSDETKRNERIGRIPVGRFGEPEDLVGATVLLASNESDFINGASLMIDGGQTIW
ncbi:SDR family NAD(P)-dependent oxidoreductase [Mesobacillus harenae]|uniref:SDR family NAD(P)-dependent oxidoreductase n=1 Tax=Mesobacillus harenae TaxID=2213203 RepID=UPI00157FECEF|nr:glucose 1-dehydrogenase [Mesobacillus harenae]